ncbi:MAG TPA: DUF1513 domain-containing protein [Hansschlegelia sp.]
MHLDRRNAVLALGSAALAGLAPFRAFADEAAPRLLGSSVDISGAFRVGLLDEALEETPGAVTPVRMHALSARPDGREAVGVGRRPADIAMVFDAQGRTIRSTFNATPGRRFSGHGAYSADGRIFLSAEIDAETGDGVVVTRDVAGGYRASAECRSAGVGPHELLPTGRFVAVANGAKEPKSEPGIAALGRTRARSNLALVDPLTGAVDRVAEVDDESATLSLRHLALTPSGDVLVAAQDTQAGAHDHPLIARLDGDRLRWLDPGYAINARFGGYVGTLAIDRSGRYVAASSPKGGIVAVFDIQTEDVLGIVAIPDCCGLAAEAAPGRFVASNGLGEVIRIAAHDGGAAIVDRRMGRLRWDNHLALLPV